MYIRAAKCIKKGLSHHIILLYTFTPFYSLQPKSLSKAFCRLMLLEGGNGWRCRAQQSYYVVQSLRLLITRRRTGALLHRQGCSIPASGRCSRARQAWKVLGRRFQVIAAVSCFSRISDILRGIHMPDEYRTLQSRLYYIYGNVMLMIFRTYYFL